MEFRVLALGDVTSEDGTRHLARTLRPFQKVHGVDFTVVNGENVSGVGLTPDQAEDLFAAGADVITLGNHTWGKMQIADYLEDSPYILRPANFSPRTPGRGVGVYDCGRFRPASGPCKAQGALFTLDSATGLCTAVERVDIR